MTDIDEVLKERGSNYGPFDNNAKISTQLFSVVIENNANLEPIHQEALKMILHKIARILNGEPNFKDSWTDIIGYARLVEKYIEDKELGAKMCYPFTLDPAFIPPAPVDDDIPF